MLFLLGCLYFCALPLLAQEENDPETDPLEGYRFITNVILQLDNRNERYYGIGARMNGLRIGIEMERTLRLGFGIYGNNTFYSFEPPSASDSLQQSIHFGYTTVFMEWVLFENFRWELSMPMTYGGGRIRLNNFALRNGQPEFVGTDTLRRNRLLDIGLMGHVKIFPWIGVGAGVGYRQMLIRDPLYRKPFSAPYVDFKIKIFIGYVYKGIFKPEVVTMERDEYLNERAARKAKR